MLAPGGATYVRAVVQLAALLVSGTTTLYERFRGTMCTIKGAAHDHGPVVYSSVHGVSKLS